MPPPDPARPGAVEDDAPHAVDRVRTARGDELALRRHAGHFEIISNGMFLMDTRDGRSERLLVRAALDRCAAPAPHVLIGGLGVGFTLAEARSDPRAAGITVVEVEPAVVSWFRRYLDDPAAPVAADPRVRVVEADLRDVLREPGPGYDVICLDVDNGPEWTVVPANGELYTDAGLARLRDRLNPGGVLAVWSAHRVDAFQARLAGTFAIVERHEVPVPRGDPDVVYLATG